QGFKFGALARGGYAGAECGDGDGGGEG
ncbi:MAG: hypothetical protein ACJATP_003125, partial [Candidatus Azotimanducaceae bacterium]